MADNHVTKDLLRHCFAQFWSSVEDLRPEEVHALVDAFVQSCVRADMREKFRRSFDSSKAVTKRFFTSAHESVSKDLGISQIVRQSAGDEITAEVTWSLGSDGPIAFRLRGNSNRKLGDILIEEGDAILRLNLGRRVIFIFAGGHRNSFYLFK